MIQTKLMQLSIVVGVFLVIIDAANTTTALNTGINYLLLLGVHKSGTTAMEQMILHNCEVKRVSISEVHRLRPTFTGAKEPGFFYSWGDAMGEHYWNRSSSDSLDPRPYTDARRASFLEHIQSFYPNPTEGDFLFDGSSGYFSHHQWGIQQRMKSYLGLSQKFLVVMRDPITRMESDWNFNIHYMKQQRDEYGPGRWDTFLKLAATNTIDNVVERMTRKSDDGIYGYAGKDRFVESIFTFGLYDQQLLEWVRVGFDASNFCIVSSNYLKKYRHSTLRLVEGHFGLKCKDTPMGKERANVNTHKDRLSNHSRVLLNNFYEENGMVTWNALNQHGYLGCGDPFNTDVLSGVLQELLKADR